MTLLAIPTSAKRPRISSWWTRPCSTCGDNHLVYSESQLDQAEGLWGSDIFMEFVALPASGSNIKSQCRVPHHISRLTGISTSILYIMGEWHCNKVVKEDGGFMVAGQGITPNENF